MQIIESEWILSWVAMLRISWSISPKFNPKQEVPSKNKVAKWLWPQAIHRIQLLRMEGFQAACKRSFLLNISANKISTFYPQIQKIERAELKNSRARPHQLWWILKETETTSQVNCISSSSKSTLSHKRDQRYPVWGSVDKWAEIRQAVSRSRAIKSWIISWIIKISKCRRIRNRLLRRMAPILDQATEINRL